jgi:hypothetical protein
MALENTNRVARYSTYQQQLARLFLTIFLTSFSVFCERRTLANKPFPGPQTGSIKGKVVADIPQQRKVVGGVTVTLSGNILGDKAPVT